MKYAVAIDIGGTNTRVALIDENYEIEQRIQFPTDADDPYATMNQIKEVIDGFDKDIVGVGMSCRLDFNFARTTALVVFQSAFFCNFYHFYSVLVILCAFIYKILTLSYNTIQK